MRELDGLIEQVEATMAERDAAASGRADAEAALAEAQTASQDAGAAAQRRAELQVGLRVEMLEISWRVAATVCGSYDTSCRGVVRCRSAGGLGTIRIALLCRIGAPVS